MEKEKLYKDRDIEAQGDIYFDHIRAMTSESLHSKSAIAAELAHRDILISQIKRQLDTLTITNAMYSTTIDQVSKEIDRLKQNSN